jgi:HAMP domain-containing protein
VADTTVWWRRICLEKQLPSIRFMAGIRAPAVICCLCLVVISGLALLDFRGTPGRSVPRGILVSQGQVAGRLARGLRSAVSRTRDDLVAAGAAYAANPTRTSAPGPARQALLASIDTDAGPWTAAGLVAADSHEVLAQRGQPLPLAQLPAAVTASTVIPVIAADRDPAVLMAVTLPDRQLLVASVPLRLRQLYLNPSAQQSVFIGTPRGGFAGGQGPAMSGADHAVSQVITRAITGAVRTGSRVSRMAGDTAPAGQPHDDHQPATGLVVTAAPIGDLGIAVVSVVRVALVPTTTSWRGLPVALGLLGVTAGVLLLLETALARPVNRLLTRATAVAAGDIQVTAGPIRCSEARRVDLALDAIAARLAAGARPQRPADSGSGAGSGAGSGRRRTMVGSARASLVVLVASGLVVGWAGLVGYRYAFTQTRLPDQITYDTGTTTDGIALAIRECFSGGLSRLAAEAHRPDAGQPAAAQLAVTRLVRDDHAFRSAYLVDTHGHPVLRSGRDPSRSGSGQPRVNGVFLDRPGGRTPVIYAAVPFPGDRVLVGEFDVGHLRSLMPRSGGRLRVVDAQMRVLLDTEGFIAFSHLPDSTLRQVATRASRGERVVTVTRIGGVGTLVAASAISRDGFTAPLGLALVSQRSTSTFQLPDNEPRHAAWLVSFLALGIAVLLRVWYGLTVLGPLRAVAAAADRLAGGDVRSVITAMRPDEVGSIAICLDLCRQVLVDGPVRFGGTTRYAPMTREE